MNQEQMLALFDEHVNEPKPPIKLLPTQRIETDEETILIKVLTDIHYGNPQLNESKLDRAIAEIQHTPNMYWICLGDVTENNTKLQKHAGVYGQAYRPKLQYRRAKQKLGPIMHKCWGFAGGNHDERSGEQTDIDMIEELLDYYEMRDLYVPTIGLVKVRVGSRTRTGGRRGPNGDPCHYDIVFRHGTGGASTTGAKANAIEKLGNVCVADLYLQGHVHSSVHFTDRLFVPSPHDKQTISERVRTYAVCPSLVEYGDYAAKSGMRPQMTGTTTIRLDTTRERISVQFDYQ